MAQNIFQQYGIKEVADVQFEALAADASGVLAGDIVLYLDTLKVSTIETTAESTEAKGGKGAPILIMWDYGKEITVTLEDAVFTPESLRIMLGGKNVVSGATTTVTIRKNVETVAASTTTSLTKPTAVGTTHKWINSTTGARGTSALAPSVTAGDRIRYFWDEPITTTGAAIEIIISPYTFPGTYKVIGDTVIRNKATGADESFQFVIEKAKITSETTLTMEAEGDPSTFSMTLRVLRDESGNMMSLKKY